MRKKLLYSFSFIILITLPAWLHAQAHINFSTYLGGSGKDSITNTVVLNGETYVLANTTSADYPVTNGSSYSGGKDAVITKFNNDGSIAYSTYIGGSGDDNFSWMQVIGGEVYIAGTTNSANFPVTNGSAYSGGTDAAIVKLSTSGTVAFSTFYGGSGNETISGSTPLQVIGSDLYLMGSTNSSNFPINSGTHFAGGTGDVFLIKLNSTNGNTIFSTCIGGNNNDVPSYLTIQNGKIFIEGRTTSSNFPVINGLGYGGSDDVFVVELNTGGTIDYATCLGGSGQDITLIFQVINGEAYLNGISTSFNFPVTDGSINQSGGSTFITKLNTDGTISFSKYMETEVFEDDIALNLKVDNNNVYLLYRRSFGSGDNEIFNYVTKLNGITGDVVYSTAIKGVINNDGSSEKLITNMQVSNGEVYLNGITRSPNHPVTDGTAYYPGGSSAYFTRLDINGTIASSTYLGEMSTIGSMQLINNKVYMLGTADVASAITTNGSSFSGGADNILFILNPDATTDFATYLGGSGTESASFQVNNDEVYITGRTNSADYPVSNNTRYKANDDISFTRIQFCPFDYDVTADTLSPATQTTCRQGLGALIKGRPILMAQTDAPVLYRNGMAQAQNNIEATYQWQTASSLSGPWTNINTAGATINYLPTGGNATLYYRRLAYTLPGCGRPVIDTSDVATVLINSNLSPIVNAGGNFYTCPGTPITIGGSPTVSGGTSPYTYSWDMGAGAIANPVVSPATATIYTVTVTDALGCQQLGQAIVNSYKANAGADKSNCASTPVQIGTAGVPGLTGITYSWLPVTDLTNANIAQPFANPAVPVTYTLTVEVPVSGGGSCITTDDVLITPVAAPAVPDFAGPDQVICLGDAVSLGYAPEAGFTYTWAPSTYLQEDTNSIAVFFAGNVEMPYPNPSTIYLTAKKGSCSFVDKTIVAVTEARADIDYCGPRIIGLPDRTPDINETYLWTKSGPGNFTGPTNQPQIPVSSSVGGTTVYTLQVTYNGHSCTDDVAVPECAGGCLTQIHATAKYSCPSYNVNNGNVSLTATCGLPDVTFTWSPADGLSNTIGATVQLTDNIQRTYTVTATSIYDPSVNCSDSIQVNNPASALPVFTAPDVLACPNKAITIGAAPVAGYSYVWTGTGLSSYIIANPKATVPNSASFIVRVSDSTGCTINDVVNVRVEQALPDPIAANVTVCNNAIIKLGNPAVPGTIYTWNPIASPWQNGTDQSFAQPEVLVAGDLHFVRVTQTPAGCTKFDAVDVVVDNSPAIPDAPDTTACAGIGVKIGSPALPNVTYLWSPVTGLSDPAIAQPIASPATNTVYTVLATFPGSCSGPAIDQVSVTVSDPAFTLPPVSFCPSGGPVSLGTAAPAGMATYTWSPAEQVSNYQIANPTTLNPPPSSLASYTLTVKNTAGCVASSSVILTPGQSAPIPGANKSLCVNSSIGLGSNANTTGPGISYQWSPATYLDNSNSIQPLFTAVDSGTFIYTLTKTDVNISCVSTATVVVRVNNFTLPAIASSVICENSCKEIGTVAEPGANYVWSPATGLSNSNIANPVVCVGTTGMSYSLTATGATGCTATANVVVSVNPAPAPQITIPSVTACNGVNNILFNPLITPSGSYNYLWSPADGSLSDIYSATPELYYTGTGSKQYTLTVTDIATGCSNTASGSVVVNTCATDASIGDFVWYDVNKDGIQDNSEIGATGISVTIYNSFGSMLATTFTDGNGRYLLQNIQPGSGYYIVFGSSLGNSFTMQNVGGALSSNNSKPDITGRTGSFALLAGDTLTNLDAGISPPMVLPIVLINFSGELNNNAVVLNWITGAEYDNDYFIIERSNDGVNYSAIGKVDGYGTSSLTHFYNFTDNLPANGVNYYRLRQVDHDGDNDYSNIVAIKDINKKQFATAYYMTTENSIFVLFDELQIGNISFNLFADNGQLISSTTAENVITKKINTNTLSAGIYMLQIISNQNTYTQKIFVKK